MPDSQSEREREGNAEKSDLVEERMKKWEMERGQGEKWNCEKRSE